MPDEKKCCCGCQKPENAEIKPEECSPEQVEACHGDEKEHPCEKASDGE